MNKHSPVQSDLFETAFSNAPATPKVEQSAPSSSAPTLLEYTHKIALRIWPTDHTRKHNLRGIQWFADYKDFGQLSMADIRKGHIYEFVEYLIDTRGISQNSGNRYMAAISRVMREANKKDIIDNPIKLEYTSAKNGRPLYLTRQKQDELVQYLRDLDKSWMADMVILACNTGMRRGEILSITDPLVELEGKFLYLPAEYCKSGEERYVPLNDEAREAYDRLLPIIDKVWSHRTFYWFWNKAKRDVGKNDPNFVFHITRHTAATRLANDVGMSEFNVADIMGHADTRTTRRYVKSKKAALLAGVQAL